jgi:hypothetical protein
MIHQAARRTVSHSSSSSDQESVDHGNDSPSHHSQADDGEFMDTTEDDDLNGKDAAALHDIFDSEVCSMAVFTLNVV